MKDNAVYLRHIRDAIVRIRRYAAGGREDFLSRPMVQDAVMRNLEIIKVHIQCPNTTSFS